MHFCAFGGTLTSAEAPLEQREEARAAAVLEIVRQEARRELREREERVQLELLEERRRPEGGRVRDGRRERHPLQRHLLRLLLARVHALCPSALTRARRLPLRRNSGRRRVRRGPSGPRARVGRRLGAVRSWQLAGASGLARRTQSLVVRLHVTEERLQRVALRQQLRAFRFSSYRAEVNCRTSKSTGHVN